MKHRWRQRPELGVTGGGGGVDLNTHEKKMKEEDFWVFRGLGIFGLEQFEDFWVFGGDLGVRVLGITLGNEEEGGRKGRREGKERKLAGSALK